MLELLTGPMELQGVGIAICRAFYGADDDGTGGNEGGASLASEFSFIW